MSWLKLLWSKIAEAVLCLRPGRVTLDYPFAPHDPEGQFRGLPRVDVNRCIGCGGCANVCPARLIRVVDTDQCTRALVFLYERCTYCGRCAEVCPEGAIEMTGRYELSTDDVHDDMIGEYHIFMGPCERCGRCFQPPTPLDRLQQTGMRHDRIDRKRPVAVREEGE
ncbi:MAG: 4Fe-4S dicluster domain-containing protein [Armatimonadota bacterium]